MGVVNGNIRGKWVQVSMRLRGKMRKRVVLQGEEKGFNKRIGRGQGKVLLRSKRKTVKEDHMGRSDLTATKRMNKPRLCPRW